MTQTQQLLTIAVIALGTMLTRFLPFLVFPAGKPVPKTVEKLGNLLPGAVFSLLVVYCLKLCVCGLVLIDGYNLNVSRLCDGIRYYYRGRVAVDLNHSKSVCHIGDLLSLVDIADLDTLLRYVCFHSLVHLIEREGVSNKILNRNVHLAALLQECHGLGIILCGVVPGADDVDLLVAHSEVGVDLVFAVVNEEAHLTHAAAATDVAVNVSCRYGSAGALICEVNANTVGNLFNLSDSLVESVFVGTTEADGGLSTHLLRYLKSVLVTVNRDNVVDTCGAENGDHYETNGTAALHENLGAEVKKTGLLASLKCVYANTRKLEDHSLLKVKLVNLEIGYTVAALDYHIVCEPTVNSVTFSCTSLVTDQTENALIVTKIGSAGNHTASVAIAAADYGGNDLVANLQGLACGVAIYVFTDRNDLARALVTENYGNETEGVHFPLVYVGSADACALNSYENIVVAKRGDRDLLYFDFLRTGKHCNVSCCGDGTCSLCGSALTHGAYHGANDAFDLRSCDIHVMYILS